jgi:hypothetical protein
MLKNRVDRDSSRLRSGKESSHVLGYTGPPDTTAEGRLAHDAWTTRERNMASAAGDDEGRTASAVELDRLSWGKAHHTYLLSPSTSSMIGTSSVLLIHISVIRMDSIIKCW